MVDVEFGYDTSCVAIYNDGFSSCYASDYHELNTLLQTWSLGRISVNYIHSSWFEDIDADIGRGTDHEPR